jgi:uncharacterized membrane protein YccF (DUF307 family)
VRTLGNILWLVLAGIWMAMAYIVAGLLNVVFIVTIPFAVQCFKLAGYALWPFGRVVVKTPGKSAAVRGIANFIWFFISGIWLALGHVLTGALLCITIVGIPLGVASFKMAKLALLPFGREIVPAGMVPAGGNVVASVPALG